MIIEYFYHYAYLKLYWKPMWFIFERKLTHAGVSSHVTYQQGNVASKVMSVV